MYISSFILSTLWLGIVCATESGMPIPEDDGNTESSQLGFVEVVEGPLIAISGMAIPEDVGNTESSQLDFVEVVNSVLRMRDEGSYLEEFNLTFKYDPTEGFDGTYNQWIKFSVKSLANDFSFKLHPRKPEEPLYMPPNDLFECTTYRMLSLMGCNLCLDAEIQWNVLTRLRLENCLLNEDVTEKIMSACSNMADLGLIRCTGITRLNVTLESLRKLTIVESEDVLVLIAPKIQVLNVTVGTGLLGQRKLLLQDISAVIYAFVDFTTSMEAIDEGAYAQIRSFFRDLSHVKQLVLRKDCLKIVSLMKSEPPLTLGAEILTLESANDNYARCLSGIIFMLNSTVEVKELRLCSTQANEENDESIPADAYDLLCDLPELKTVKIEDFGSPNGNLILKLAAIVLQRATSLKNMFVNTWSKDVQQMRNIYTKIREMHHSSTDVLIHPQDWYEGQIPPV